MPILKSSEPLPKRPVIILIYGEPGIGKTSLFNTSANPLLIDFDRGKDRAIFRQDTLVVNSWEDIIAEEKTDSFKGYSTIGIDTAKSALDDFLMSYVIKQDYKRAKNKLQAYGALGDEFKVFVSNRRSEAADIVIICHSKDDKDGEQTKKIPDVTGGSYQLLLRIADQVGYMSMRNGRRTIEWNPTDTTIGKNVARLQATEIPVESEPACKTFLSTIIEKVKESIVSMSEAQQEALKKLQEFEAKIMSAETTNDLTSLVADVKTFPKTMATALAAKMGEKAKAKGWEWDKETKVYKDPSAKPQSAEEEQEPAEQEELNF